MIRSMVSGKLVRDPQSKTSAAGKGYTSGVVKADQDGDAALFVRVLAFGDAAERLAGLHCGDAVSAAGALKVEIYAPEGKDPRPNLTLLADELLSVRRALRERRPPGRGDGARS